VSSMQLAQSTLSQVIDPPRVRVVRTGAIRTVRTGSGELLRGVAVSSYRYQRQTGQAAYLHDLKYWDALKAAGVNAIRLIAMDGWQRSHGLPGKYTPFPHTDLYDSKQTAEMLSAFDNIVNQASARGMVVMINFHDTGNYHDLDYTVPADANGQFAPIATRQYVTRFWNLVAPRYANRTHVFYELVNEPVQWSSGDYLWTDARKIKVLFESVRRFAPRTHIVLQSFATHHSHNARSMRDVAYELLDNGVDFGNASLGVHPYNLFYPEPNESAPILDLMRNFTVINTEQNFPKGIIPRSRDPDGSGLDGDCLGVQSMERLGISWFHWNCDLPQEFTDNFAGIVVRDAKSKGYYWVNSGALNTILPSSAR
jgi:hypothetical protein